MNRFIISLVAIMMAIFSTLSLADDDSAARNEGKFNFLLGAQITFGGDTLGSFEVEDFFGDTDTNKIKAGELFGVFVGGVYRFPGTSFQIQSTIGYHTDGIFADNGDANFDRFPVEVLALFSVGRHRFGGGLSYHLNPEYETDIDFGLDTETDFDDASGLVLQYDFNIGAGARIGVRYVDIEYEAETTRTVFGTTFYQSEKIDGAHGGIIFTYLF